jgi:hypothetical protein
MPSRRRPGGSAENIKLLQQGKIELALAQPDLAWAASQGQPKACPERSWCVTCSAPTPGTCISSRSARLIEAARVGRVAPASALASILQDMRI